MHIIQSTRTKKTFCWCYTKYTRKLLSVSLKASVKRRSEHLNDRCLNFTDEFKHSELSHFTSQTSIQHKKSKTKKQIIFLWDCFYLKVKSQNGGLPAGQLGMFKPRSQGLSSTGAVRWEMLGTRLGMFFLSAKDEIQLLGTEPCCSTAFMIPNSNFNLKTIFCRSTQV